MAASAEFSLPFTMIEGRYGGKENGSSAAGEDPETPEDMKETKAGKPPRHLSVIRHCVSTTRLADSTDLVCYLHGLMPFECSVYISLLFVAFVITTNSLLSL